MDGFEGGYYFVQLVEELHPDHHMTWFAEHPELPGCNAVGDSQSEALANLEKSREAWLLWARQHELPIPQPREHPSIAVQYANRPGQTPAEEAGADQGVTKIKVAA